MKGKMKKIIAAVATLAMTAQFAFVLPVSAATTYWSHDFESDADSAAWTSNAGTASASIATDSTKYLKVVSNGSGPRGVLYEMPDAAKQKDDDGMAVLEFDFALQYCSYGGGEIAFATSPNSGTKFGNSFFGGTGVALQITQDSAGKVTINGAAGSVTQTTAYPSGGWAHAKAVLNFTEKKTVVTITDKAGTNTYLAETQVPMSSDTASLGSICAVGPRVNGGGYAAIDNIVVREFEDADLTNVYYSVTFDVDGKTTPLSVKKNEKVESGSVPSTDKTGYLFKGWNKDTDTSTLISTDDVLDTAVTADVKYTAVYEKDPEYIEPLAGIQLVIPNSGILEMGTSDTDFKSNSISVKLTGEIGTDLYKNKDDRTDDIDVDWTFEGFNTMVDVNTGTSKATAEGKDEAGNDTFCDTYGKVIYDSTNPTVADFKLAKQFSNYYGRVKVSVTYGPSDARVTKTAEAPLAILANKAQASGTILPKAGYISDFNYYEDSMVGYKAVTSGDNAHASDIVTGDWAAYGGNNGRGLYIVKEDGKKFLQVHATGTNSSSFGAIELSAPSGQVIISQDVRFYNANSAILYKQANPVSWNSDKKPIADTTMSITFDGSKLKLHEGTEICSAATGVWYHIVMSADVTSKMCYAKVYDMEGQLLGESDAVAFSHPDSVKPVYLCYRTPDNSNGTLDFNNAKVYVPEIQGNLTTTIENETLSIPETASDPASTTSLTVSAKSNEGYDMIGAAKWSIIGEPDQVTITPDPSDTHKATLSVANGAPSGEIVVRVALGGKTKDITVNLSGSQDSVIFKKKDSSDKPLSPASISIPLVAGQTDTYTYVAEVVDKDGAAIAGHPVTYEVYDKNNANVLSAMPTGITFDKATGVLTVDSTAKATTFYIRATGTNTADPPEVISRSQKVLVHGLAFDFGTGTDDAVAEGYTAITPDTAYTESAGYGIASGTATADGTGTTENADADSLKGTFKFQAKVQEGKVYKITVNYSGKAAAEYVNSDLTGIAYENTSKSAATYTVAVIDDILDLSFDNATVSSVVIEKQDDKAPNAKPHIYDVGDSTAANNGSWAYTLANRMANDASPYKELAALASFTNNGRGGKNLSTYYTGGELNDRVLVNIHPGDIMMIGNMGTNGMGNSFADDFNYYIDAAEKMGASIIINSYSPDGGSGYYDSSSKTFTGVRTGLDGAVKPIADARAESDPQYLGYVDLGGKAVEAFNAYVADYAANDYADEDAAAAAIYNCYSDHNHYSNAATACNLMLEGYTPTNGEHIKGTVEMITDILSNKYEVSSIAKSTLKDGTETGDKALTFTATGNTGNGTQIIKLIIAQYNSTGALVNVKMQDGVFSKITNTVDVEFTPVADATVKAFTWDGMTPLLTNTTVTDVDRT